MKHFAQCPLRDCSRNTFIGAINFLYRHPPRTDRERLNDGMLSRLGALCRRQGLYEQADFIESCATKSAQDPQAIDRALAIIRQLRIYDDTNQGAGRRAVQQPPPQEYGRLRRSGSFQKLRQSIRRGSEKLVQKLRGTSTTGWGNPPYNSSQYPQQDSPEQPSHEYSYGPMKRASSLSVLNHVPLQQQPVNRPPNAVNLMDQPNTFSSKPQYSTMSYRGRLNSAENLH